jgi:hypothetical protein
LYLRDREIEGLQRFRSGVLEERSRARDAEDGLFLHALERPRHLQFFA